MASRDNDVVIELDLWASETQPEGERGTKKDINGIPETVGENVKDSESLKVGRQRNKMSTVELYCGG